MNRSKIILISLIAILFIGSPLLKADTEHKHPAPYKGSEAFERLKGLAGSWEGESSEKEAMPGPIRVDYKVTSNESAVLETISPGTPHEMVSVYHEEKGKLKMTHYCMLGNQPKMELKNATEKTLDFDFSEDNTIDPTSEQHMHGLMLEMPDANHLKQSWKSYENGSHNHTTIFDLKRV